MDGSNNCLSCGAPCPASAPGGLCSDCSVEKPRINDSNVDDATTPFEPGAFGETVLEKLAVDVGSLPHIRLRDTRPADQRSVSGGLPGFQLERLQLYGEIARGGMGAVLKGRDPDLGRDLAVKVLLERHHDNPDLIRRFIEEAQIAGQLQHPGIVPVYELGAMADRRPYFSMKLVEGRTLAQLLAERSAAGGGESDQRAGETADLPRFLPIFEAICQTVAYAHARGVIHRDLKPSNVMVGAFGEVQVMDWGLAKVLTRAGDAQDSAADNALHENVVATAGGRGAGGHSQSGSIMGTPGYMPPEQARGELDRVDERADVFALGSILCQMLTGKPAFVGRNAGEILRAAAQADLSEAGRRLDACPADPDLIGLAKACLEVERESRPRHAGIVAQAVAAYLTGVQERLRKAELLRVEAQARAEEEVKLRLVSNQLASEARARVVAEQKRQRVTLGLAVSILALALLGGGWSFWVVQELQSLDNKVRVALNEAEVRREQAFRGSGDLNLWTSAREAGRRAASLLGDKGSAELRQRTRELVARIDEESAEAASDRQLLESLADVRAARLDRGLTATDAAYALAFTDYGVDVEQTETELAAGSFLSRPGTFAVKVAAALDDWTVVRRGRMREGADWTRPLVLALTIDPEPFRERIRETLKQADLRPQRDLLRQMALDANADQLPPPSAVLLALALAGAGDVEAAVDLLQKSTERHADDLWVNFELAGHLLELKPARPDEAIRYFTAARALRPTSAHSLAHALEDRGRTAEAIGVFQDLERRQADEGTHVGCLGHALKSLGRTDEAREAFERAIVALRSAIAEHPDEPAHLHNLGTALRGLGRSEEALDAFGAALNLHPGLAKTRSAMGVVLAEIGRADEAEAAYREALKYEPDLMTARANLASVLQYQGRLEEAIAEFRALVGDQPHLASLHYNLGNALWAHRELESAAAEQREALHFDPNHIEARVNLGCILGDLGQSAEAIAMLRDALQQRPGHSKALYNLASALTKAGDLDGLSDLASGNPGQTSPLMHLGKALCDAERFEEALEPLSQAVALEPESGWALTMLGICQAKVQKYGQAVETLQKAAKYSPDDPVVLLNLGSAHYSQNAYDKAVIAYRQSLGLKPDDPHVQASLAHALYCLGELTGAVEAYREAIRLDPTDADFRYRLGRTFEQMEANGDAIIAYRDAIRLSSDFPDAREHLGVVLYKEGKADEALAVYQDAIQLHPELADGHYGLGTIYMLVGRGDEATASFREAVRLDSKHAEAQCNLGQALKACGSFDEALAHFRLGHELGSKRADWRYPSADWVSECEKLVEIDRFLSEVLAGAAQPEDNSQRLALGIVAQMKGRYATAIRFYSEAISSGPKLVADPSESVLRYRAACAAVLAGCGRGNDKPAPDESDRAQLRSQALRWLRSDLESWNQIAATAVPGRNNRELTWNTMALWKKEASLAGVREESALAALPEAERADWQAFWSDVDQLLRKTSQ